MPKSLDDYTKQDWLLANTHGAISPCTVIYRVFRTDHLLSDLTQNVNTLVHPCYETQEDDLENPLKLAEFTVDGAKRQLFSSLMAEYYAQSWSVTKPDWETFGEGEDTVRVASTVGNIFSRLMDERDRFYSLYYHAGLVEYDDSDAIKQEMLRSRYENFLDSQGYGLLKTVLKIRADFRREREVRFVYIRSPRHDHDYPLRNHVFGDQSQFCAHAFEWHGAIDSFAFSPINHSEHPDVRGQLERFTR